MLLDQTGKVLREIRLRREYTPDTYWTGYTWVGENRFIITRSVHSVEGKAKAWWVDVETGKVNAIADFDCPSVGRIAGFPDGSFVALATTWMFPLAFAGSSISLMVVGIACLRFGPRVIRWLNPDDSASPCRPPN